MDAGASEGARHREGLLNYCRVKVRFGVVEAINGNIKSIMRRGRGVRRQLLLPARGRCQALNLHP